MTKQLFGYTPINPIGLVGYIQLHKDGVGEYLVVVRDHNQPVGDTEKTASSPLTLDGLRGLQHAISLELAATAPDAATSIHPAPVEFTEDELRTTPILRYFHYSHLPPHLQERSRPFAVQARNIMDTTPISAERTAGLRKLLECKDCIVRAALP